jgi:hypothetical protein
MKSPAQLGSAAGHRDPAADFVTGDQRGDKALAVGMIDTKLKELEKDKEITQDDHRHGHDKVEALTKEYIEKVDKAVEGANALPARLTKISRQRLDTDWMAVTRSE